MYVVPAERGLFQVTGGEDGEMGRPLVYGHWSLHQFTPGDIDWCEQEDAGSHLVLVGIGFIREV